MQRLILAVAALVTVSLAAPAAAQTARATGTVRDTTGSPIRGATIRALNPDAYPPEITSTSDDKGRWGMVGLRTGNWRFVVDAPGFFQVDATAAVRVAGTPPMQFTLAKDPGPIPGALPANIVQLINQAAALREKGYYDMALSAYGDLRAKNPRLTSLNLVIGDIYRQKAAQQEVADAKRASLDLAIEAYSEALKADSGNERARAGLESTRAEAAKLQ